MEAKSGSLGRAMVVSRRRLRAELGSAGQPRAAVPTLFTSLKDGMQQMIEALLARMPASNCRLAMRVEAVTPESCKWLVVSEGRRTEEFDAVIVALPAYLAAKILADAGELAADLAAIRYSSSVTVALGYDEAVRAALPAGFGFLVPRNENKRMLAVTFVHNKFSHRVPENMALIRASWVELAMKISPRIQKTILKPWFAASWNKFSGSKRNRALSGFTNGSTRWPNTE